MKALPYIIAGLAALGICAVIVLAPTSDDVASDDTASDNAAFDNTAVASSTNTASPATTLVSAGEMTVAVPQMHCQYSCFPKVKETLESMDNVASVELAPQADPTTLDNRQVIVKYDAGFNVDAALEGLNENGFADSSVVQ